MGSWCGNRLKERSTQYSTAWHRDSTKTQIFAMLGGLVWEHWGGQETPPSVCLPPPSDSGWSDLEEAEGFVLQRYCPVVKADKQDGLGIPCSAPTAQHFTFPSKRPCSSLVPCPTQRPEPRSAHTLQQLSSLLALSSKAGGVIT